MSAISASDGGADGLQVHVRDSSKHTRLVCVLHSLLCVTWLGVWAEINHAQSLEYYVHLLANNLRPWYEHQYLCHGSKPDD